MFSSCLSFHADPQHRGGENSDHSPKEPVAYELDGEHLLRVTARLPSQRSDNYGEGDHRPACEVQCLVDKFSRHSVESRGLGRGGAGSDRSGAAKGQKLHIHRSGLGFAVGERVVSERSALKARKARIGHAHVQGGGQRVEGDEKRVPSPRRTVLSMEAPRYFLNAVDSNMPFF
eukprot:CAMPEP_0118965952 /NCGR_PEP_ID=MMETSP1173-20130426/3461_1 /TAXON_ID=1034831 /ORGANISM="Rhizochromulina marina cf, Strain CCMP1243" /LENGTH=173 /DNA_ID=CAMNT_0006914649 /DNA_START=183 /DNA_END=705 /DNA_ORIENTATION=+